MCESGKIILRFIRKDDTDDIIRWRNSKQVKQFFIYQEDITRETHMKWLDTRVAKGEVVQFIILYENKAIGSVYLKDIDRKHRKAELGIFIGEPDLVESGIGTEAVVLCTKYAFQTLKLHRVYLRVFETNQRAIRCYEKAGFTKEARLRDDVWENGSYRNIILMAVINPYED